jgi:hypothetical protein
LVTTAANVRIGIFVILVKKVTTKPTAMLVTTAPKAPK